ncbi:hypothetical protein DPMN_013159 [Dreissena polymorpha]|uniref:Uncharacterized protein n=1 Tax=Dreissena polymorpha TaxID=45954 RepID=A0A9D4S3E9_DREPO|nr:hypothetical protein DPMN_013159 [Dreissena polymorpha]
MTKRDFGDGFNANATYLVDSSGNWRSVLGAQLNYIDVKASTDGSNKRLDAKATHDFGERFRAKVKGYVDTKFNLNNMDVKAGTRWSKVPPNAGLTRDFGDDFFAKANRHLDTIGTWELSFALRLNDANVMGRTDVQTRDGNMILVMARVLRLKIRLIPTEIGEDLLRRRIKMLMPRL